MKIEIGRTITTGPGPSSFKPQAVQLDLPRLIDSRLLITASSGGGKSWALRLIAEQSCKSVQTVILDPEGEFASLREKFDFLLVAKGGEIQPEIRAAGLLARKLAEIQVSAVIDLFDLHFDQRKQFVRQFLESLVNVPRTLWHPMLVVLDEAHKFCPEGKDSESSNAVIDLMSQGRKRGFCGVLATQRLSKLNKDAAAEANNNLIGRTILDNDQKRAADILGMAKSDWHRLRDLPDGGWFGFGPAFVGTAGVTNFVTGDVQTTHPKAGQRHKLTPPKASDVVKQIAAQLADLPKQAEAGIKTLEDAKKKIRDLEREARARPKDAGDPAVVKKQIDAALVNSQRTFESVIVKNQRTYEAQIASLQKMIGEAMKFIVEVNAKDFFDAGKEVDQKQVTKAIESAVQQAMKLIDQKLSASRTEFDEWRRKGGRILKMMEAMMDKEEVKVSVNVRHNEPFTVQPSSSRQPIATMNVNGNGHLPIGESLTLAALIQYPAGLQRNQLTVLTGYKRSTRDAYISRLRERGFVGEDGGKIIATQEGISVMPDAQPLPVGDELQRYWLERLPEGERRILEILLEAFPNPVERERLTEQSGYKRSTRDAYLSRLESKELIEQAGRGSVRASGNLFDVEAAR